MTDTLPVGVGTGPVPTPAPEQAPQSPALAPSISQAIDNAVRAAPELKQDPGTAVAVAAAGGTPVKAQAVAQAGKRQANATAQDQVKPTGTSIFGEIAGDVGSALGKVAHYANDGLATVQHEYRYLHDVEARHGMTAAIMEGAGILAGAAAGTVLDPGTGTVLGAEAAAGIEGQLTFKDSWQRTLNPNYKDPHTGQLVSFGRDVASAIGLHGGAQTAVSGALDGLGDMIADPLGLAGKGLGEAHSIEGMGGALGRVYQGTSLTAENVDQAFDTLPSVRRAFSDIAGMTPGDIAVRYPQFVGIANELGHADSAEAVKDTFKELAASSEMLDAAKLPTLAASRMVFRPLRDVVRNLPADAEGPVSGFLARHVVNNAVIGPRRWADRLEALPGATFDPDTMDLSGSQINPANTRGLTDIYRLMRYGGTDREARAVVDAYAAATPAQRIVIVKNGIFKTLFAMAGQTLPDDADPETSLAELVDGRTKNAILERLDNHLSSAGIEGNQPERVFGTMVDGKVVRPVIDEDGVSVQGAIRANQTGSISLPNIVEARRMAQAIQSSRTSRLLAGTDDFLYDHVTQGFFKPLVLMSGGYGLHISLAEMIPNALRHGLTTSVQGLYDRAIANLGYKADKEELGLLSGWLYSIAGRRALQSSQDAQYLTEVYLANEGYKTTTGVAAGEITQGETQPVERALSGFRQKMATGTKEGSQFSTFGNEDARMVNLWQADLREASNDRWTRTAAKAYLHNVGESESLASERARQAVADELRAEPTDTLENYVRSRYKSALAPPGWDAIDDWASAIVDALKTDVHARGEDGAAGRLHADLLTSVANGRTPSVDELDAIDPSERPLALKGRQVIPDGTGTVQRIANFGFRKILNPMVNILSRNQEFAVEYVQARRAIQPMVDQGLLTDDEAMVRAESQATTHVMRFVHNLHDRTQWTATMRNWAPFYFAQEQAYRRMGRLLAEDPGAFRRYQLAIAGIGHLSSNMQDGNGANYIAFPGSGFIGKGTADIMGLHGVMVGGVTPAAFGGSLSSANVIFPLSQGFSPDLGPIAMVPVSQLSTLLPELGKRYPTFAKATNVAASALNYIEGQSSQSQPIWEQLIPNAFVARMIEAEMGDDRAFNSSVMQAYQYLDYQQAEATAAWKKEGSKGEPPQIVPAQTAPAAVKQEFVDKVRNYIRALYVARALTGMVSPVSSNVEMTNFGFPSKLNTEITKAGSVSTGMANFLLKYPNAVPWTVAQSYVPSNTDATQPSGYSLSSSEPAIQWVDTNQRLLDKYGVAALWLMPQLTNAAYSPTVYNEQIAQGLRVKDTPAQFLNALYVAAGDDMYYGGLSVHEAALTAAGNNHTAVNAEYDTWDAWVTQLEKQYPVWAENFTSGTRQTNSQQAIQTLTQIFNAGEAPKDDQSSMVEQLLAQYQTAAAAYQQAGTTSNYSSAQSKVSDSWIAYLDSTAVQIPALKPIIQSVFKEALKVQT
jgi:thiaminase